MDFDKYQKEAFETAMESSQNIFYMTMGLCGEAGEIANKIKKVMRDAKSPDREDLKKELGDCLWYVAGMATVLGIELSDIADSNIVKLKSRKVRGVIGGSGDNR